MTAYQAYRTMKWTSDKDGCEECDRVMGEGRFVEGRLGHYCSKKCLIEAESGSDHDERGSERSQMGLVR